MRLRAELAAYLAAYIGWGPRGVLIALLGGLAIYFVALLVLGRMADASERLAARADL